MIGQWIGRFSGPANQGDVIIELDDIGSELEGRATLFEDNVALPGTYAQVKFPKNLLVHNLRVPLLALHPDTLDPTTWSAIAARYPAVNFPQFADTQWTFQGDDLTVDWITDIGTRGTGRLKLVDATRPSNLVSLSVSTWDEYCRYARTLAHYDFAYRGQGNYRWRLQTAFHRSKRSDLLKFQQVDVAALHQNLSNLTAHFFKLSDPIENAAFLSLAQHHGYPTPLLDWTYSPFIAAYFAFKYATTAEKVRIFIFDKKNWCVDFNQVAKIAPARPHFSILQAVALENPRMTPQQALASVSNLRDIEAYIQQREKQKSKTYLSAVDLSASLRDDVLGELSLMGIGPGSLFPGLDGACDQLKWQFFGK